jgi:hypothetical protein
MKELADNQGWEEESDERTGMLSFDSTMVRDGIHYDLNSDFAGIDRTQSHDVITSKFRALVSVQPMTPLLRVLLMYG